jgi:uncharacterized protein (TIGR02677 family)
MPRGRLPHVHDRSAGRKKLEAQVGEEHAQIEAARQKFATGCPLLLSELWRLNSQEFRFFLDLLGEAIATKAAGDDGVTEIQSNDGLYLIRLEPLDADTEAEIVTEDGVFCGRDHRITITPTDAA